MESRLQEIRLQADLSQQDLATQAGVSMALIQKTEQGLTTPRLVSARKLVAALSAALGRVVTIDEVWPVNTPDESPAAGVRGAESA